MINLLRFWFIDWLCGQAIEENKERLLKTRQQTFEELSATQRTTILRQQAQRFLKRK